MSEILNIGEGNMGTRYIKKKLPLSGPDYKVRVDRKGPEDDYTIQKKGDTISIDHFDNTKDIKIINKLKDEEGKISGRISIDRTGTFQDETIVQSGDRIFIDRPGFDDDVEIKKQGNEITINLASSSKYTKYRRGEENWEIDRDGFRNDVDVFREPSNYNKIKIDKYGDLDDVVVERDDNMGLDVMAWHKDLTITPEGFELITGWLDGGLNAEDLIHLSEDGSVILLDGYLY
ncbi:MAG: hypothetical protein K8T10_20380 [Candidatus Eremiobacteraeota bacterium]|nr:hypothetical protein [Candidatus Eremiobacteraeota bacterium]